MTGLVASLTTTLKLAVAVFPFTSVASHETAVDPLLNTIPPNERLERPEAVAVVAPLKV